MSTDLARWQFATTSIYHFLFVPVTIGLAFLVAILQTSWYRSGNPQHRQVPEPGRPPEPPPAVAPEQ
jgi:cytochrome d ubiquinol oxidase subunit I